MRYKAIFTDEFLSHFRLDDNGKTLVLTDRKGLTRAVMLEVEVEPRRGKWIDTGSGQECSECREIQYGYDSGRNYCPNCGAKMDSDDWKEPEINPCRGCDDYDGHGGCKSHGGCGAERIEDGQT